MGEFGTGKGKANEINWAEGLNDRKRVCTPTPAELAAKRGDRWVIFGAAVAVLFVVILLVGEYLTRMPTP